MPIITTSLGVPITSGQRRVVPFVDLCYQTTTRWVRGVVSGTTIVDSHHPVLIWEPDGAEPFYAFPYDEVCIDLLRVSRGTRPRHHPGAAEWFDLNIGKLRIPRAAWAYAVPQLSSYIAFDQTAPAVNKLLQWHERSAIH